MKNNSLTIIELLVALTIFAIVSVAIYSVFSVSVTGWKKGESAILLFSEIRLSLDRMAGEIRNQANFNGIRLAGTADEVYFVSHIFFPEEGKSEYRRLAKIRYFLEEEEDSVNLLRERTWVPFLEGQEEKDDLRLITSIKSLNFQYGTKETGDDGITLKWEDVWEKDALPAAIKINLNPGKGTDRNVTRVIYIPNGQEF